MLLIEICFKFVYNDVINNKSHDNNVKSKNDDDDDDEKMCEINDSFILRTNKDAASEKSCI